MSKGINLIGQLFDTYKVIEKSYHGNKIYWICECIICGNKKEICTNYLIHDKFQHCPTCTNKQKFSCTSTEYRLKRFYNSLAYKMPEEDFKKAVSECTNYAQLASILGYSNDGGNVRKMIKSRIEELNLDTSHFSPIANRGHTKRTFENVFCENSTCDQATLRNWFIKGNYAKYQCAICGISEWNNQPLTLRLDHINGHNKDNRLENLRWLCPNCDSQSEFYCGRNKPR